MQKIVAIDFETHLISEEQPIPKPVCLSWYDGKEWGLVAGFKDMEACLLDIMRNKNIVIAHNLSFEANIIDKYFPNVVPEMRKKLDNGTFLCTQIYEQLIDNTRKKGLYKFSLADLVYNYYQKDISEDKKNPNAWRLRYHELDGVCVTKYPEEAVRYAVEDSIWTYKIFLKQLPVKVDYKLSCMASYYLNKMANFGMRTDKDRISLIKSEMETILKPKYKILLDKGLCSVNSKGKIKKNMKEFKEYLKANVAKLETTAKGGISTSSESLNKYIGSMEDPSILLTFLDIMKYEKVLTAFIARLHGNDIIRTQYNSVVSSGRTSSRSSSFYPSVNIQQMPRELKGVSYDIRNCFKARPGYQIVSIDYNGLELAACAHQLYIQTGMSNMRDLINSGQSPVDMHSMFAKNLKTMAERKECTYEEFIANKSHPEYKPYRQYAKPINLGFPGGIGYENMRSILATYGIFPKLKVLNTSTCKNYNNLKDFVEREGGLRRQRKILRREGYPVRVRRTKFGTFELIYDELVEIKWALFQLYPDLEYFLKEGHYKMLNGEKKRQKNEFDEWETEDLYTYNAGGFLRDNCMYTQVCNGFLMQSPAAIGAKKAMCKIIEKYGNSDICHPLAFIHDEIVFEAKIGDTDAVIEDISRILIEEMQTVLHSVRIAVEADITGSHWAKEGTGKTKTFWKDPDVDKLYRSKT